MDTIKKLKKIIWILIIIILIVMGMYLLIYVLPNKDNEIKEDDNVLNYVLYERDGSLSKEIFNKLKEEVNKEEVNYEDYASYVAELFVIDLYSLSTKEYDKDVTSTQYVYESIRDNFKLKVANTLYKNITLNEEVPTVCDVVVNNVETSSYKIDDVTYDSYIVDLSISYDKDYGYDTNKLITLINVDDNMYVVDIGDTDEKTTKNN